MSSTEHHRLAILPEALFKNPNLGADEIAVIAALSLHCDANGLCWPSQGTIAQMLNKSRPWVNKVIARLVQLSIIEKTKRTRDANNGETSCLYRITLLDRTQIKSVKTTVSQTDTPCPTKNRDCHATNTKDSNPPDSNSLGSRASDRADMRTGEGRGGVPHDWQPTDSDIEWALSRFPNIDIIAHTEHFVLKCLSKGYQYQDISAAWRTWMADDAQKARTSPSIRTKYGPTLGNSASRMEVAFTAAQRAAAAKRRQPDYRAVQPYH